MKHSKYHLIVKILVVFVLIVAAGDALPAAPAGAAGALPAAPAQTDATTTITESFGGATAPGWNMVGNAGLIHEGSGWLRLTQIYQGLAGASFYNTAFPSNAVYDIDFEYATWGGNGADGLTFFMIDGSNTPTAPGGGGSGLGYDGIAGNYFAVGFSEYNVAPYSAHITIYRRGYPNYNVPANNLLASRDAPNHVHIIFNNNFVSVWLAGVKVIADINWGATPPNTFKFGFSGASGVGTDYHEVRNATIRMIRSNGILRVSPSGYSSWPCGGSWDAACTMRAAVDYAVDGTEIWAAAGTYYPGAAGLRTATYQLRSGVAIYGGFAGTETSRTERNPAAHITTLSGDLDQNGLVDDGNAYHVVTCLGADATTVLDGFTITGGNADSASFIQRGGGMYNQSGSPTIRNIHFYQNSALLRGGGMYNEGGSPTLTDVIFEQNTSAYGGGMANNLNGNANLQNVTFTNNKVHMGGAGMCNFQSSPVLTNITFSGNNATYGGGLANYYASSPHLANAIFINNIALIMGGAMYNEMSSSPILTNATIYGNVSHQVDGGIYNVFKSYPVLINSILWGNSAGSGNQIIDESTGQSITTVSHSDIQGSWTGQGNINSDPLFVDAAHGDLHLKHSSQAIDAGLNVAMTGILTDRDGNPRIVNYFVQSQATVDLGAYEVQTLKVFLPSMAR